MGYRRASEPETERSAGGALFPVLGQLGVKYVFTNSGTDFPPIIEGYVIAQRRGVEMPTPLIAPHENLAVGMAHGYYLQSGQAQAVIVHTNVGLANAAMGLINAATDHVPIILMSGRASATEEGRLGSRTTPIGWGQEMRDQAALVREACKWDYELRFPEQVPSLLARANAIAHSAPRGPVYLSLPREVLCEPCPPGLDAATRFEPARSGPRLADIEMLADMLLAARHPVVIAQRGAGSPKGFTTLSGLSERYSLPVSQFRTSCAPLPSRHPMYVEDDHGERLAAADVVLVLDSLVPWLPVQHHVNPKARIVHIGQNPLFSRFPVRNFPVDLAIACDVEDGLVALEAAMESRDQRDPDAHAQRAARREAVQSARKPAPDEADPRGITKYFVGRCLSNAIGERESTVVSELGVPLSSVDVRNHMGWISEPHSGGLGWGLPCAMGIKLADPSRLVVATVGDGSYMFANPTACHQLMEAAGIPLLTIVCNNAEWGAARKSVEMIYPDGEAVASNRMPMVSLAPSPDFALVAAASRAWSKHIENASDLPRAIAEAITEVMTHRRPALLDVKVID